MWSAIAPNLSISTLLRVKSTIEAVRIGGTSSTPHIFENVQGPIKELFQIIESCLVIGTGEWQIWPTFKILFDFGCTYLNTPHRSRDDADAVLSHIHLLFSAMVWRQKSFLIGEDIKRMLPFIPVTRTLRG